MASLTPHVAGIRRLGAGALDLAYVALGAFDAYYEQAVAAWDIAAGALLVTEAGGLATTTTGHPLDLANGTILAGSAPIHAAVLAALQAAEGA